MILFIKDKYIAVYSFSKFNNNIKLFYYSKIYINIKRLSFINKQDNFIVTSSSDTIDDRSSTKIYSLIDGNYIKSFNITKFYDIRYLLLWTDKKNNKYYIINLANKSIIIVNLFENDEFFKLYHEPESYHLSGFVYNQYDKDFLCCSSSNGLINIWDLYNKKIYKIIDINDSYLMHIIQWNKKYIIAADFDNKSFKIVDLENNKAISNICNKSNIKGQSTGNIVCVKKIYHPLFGESLLSGDNSKFIKLWVI